MVEVGADGVARDLEICLRSKASEATNLGGTDSGKAMCESG